MNILGCLLTAILMLIIVPVIIVISYVRKFMGLGFSQRPKKEKVQEAEDYTHHQSTQQATDCGNEKVRYSHSNGDEQLYIPQDAYKQKVFSDDEGEYIDCEEEKN